MPTQLFNTIFYSSLAGLATITGILLVLYFQKTAKKYSTYLISFAAGILITSAFLNLIPESLMLYQKSLIYVLIIFLVFYIIEQFIMIHSCKDDKCRIHIIGKMSVFGIGFHSLIDGLVIGAGFATNPELGIIATLAVIFHELPEGITTMSILIHSNIKRIKAITFSILVAIATPIGAVLTYFFIKNISQSALGILLAIAAGSFIYVAASDLIPETHKKFNKFNILFILIGVIFIILISSLIYI